MKHFPPLLSFWKRVFNRAALPLIALAVMFAALPLCSQTVDTKCVDGMIWVKIKSTSSMVFPRIDSLLTSTDSSYDSVKTLISNYGVTDIKVSCPNLLVKTYAFTFTMQDSVESFISSLAALSYIEYAEKIPIYKTFGSFMPNDPGIQAQWYLERIQAREAWALSHGSHRTNPIKIAVIDDAFQSDHPDLEGAVQEEWDMTTTPYTSTGHAAKPKQKLVDCSVKFGNLANACHGTEVAGIAGAVTNNNSGIASMANGAAKLMLIKIQDDVSTPLASGFTGPNIANAIDLAVAKGVDIISMSFGSDVFSQTLYDALTKACSTTTMSARGKAGGIILIAAAGNMKGDLGDNDYIGRDSKVYPAQHPNVISVGATTKEDKPWDHSVLQLAGFDPNTQARVDILAPGELMWTTERNFLLGAAGTTAESTGRYITGTGTSFAAPLVASLCARMLDIDPDLVTGPVGATSGIRYLLACPSCCDFLQGQQTSPNNKWAKSKSGNRVACENLKRINALKAIQQTLDQLEYKAGTCAPISFDFDIKQGVYTLDLSKDNIPLGTNLTLTIIPLASFPTGTPVAWEIDDIPVSFTQSGYTYTTTFSSTAGVPGTVYIAPGMHNICLGVTSLNSNCPFKTKRICHTVYVKNPPAGSIGCDFLIDGNFNDANAEKEDVTVSHVNETNGLNENQDIYTISRSSVSWKRASGLPSIYLNGGRISNADPYVGMQSSVLFNPVAYGTETYLGAQGIVNSYNFEKGKTYTICFWAKTDNLPNDKFYLYAANGVVSDVAFRHCFEQNVGTTHLTDDVYKHLFSFGAITKQKITQAGGTDFAMNFFANGNPEWRRVQLDFTAGDDYSQLWIYPDVHPTSNIDYPGGFLYIDDIRVAPKDLSCKFNLTDNVITLCADYPNISATTEVTGGDNGYTTYSWIKLPGGTAATEISSTTSSSVTFNVGSTPVVGTDVWEVTISDTRMCTEIKKTVTVKVEICGNPCDDLPCNSNGIALIATETSPGSCCYVIKLKNNLTCKNVSKYLDLSFMTSGFIPDANALDHTDGSIYKLQDGFISKDGTTIGTICNPADASVNIKISFSKTIDIDKKLVEPCSTSVDLSACNCTNNFSVTYEAVPGNGCCFKVIITKLNRNSPCSFTGYKTGSQFNGLQIFNEENHYKVTLPITVCKENSSQTGYDLTVFFNDDGVTEYHLYGDFPPCCDCNDFKINADPPIVSGTPPVCCLTWKITDVPPCAAKYDILTVTTPWSPPLGPGGPSTSVRGSYINILVNPIPTGAPITARTICAGSGGPVGYQANISEYIEIRDVNNVVLCTKPIYGCSPGQAPGQKQSEPDALPGLEVDHSINLKTQPNPTSGETTISFNLAEKSYATLELVNLLGQQVAVIASREMSEGINTITYETGKVPSGTYFIQLKYSGGVATIPLTVAPK